jgi:hypothetical protein
MVQWRARGARRCENDWRSAAGREWLGGVLAGLRLQRRGPLADRYRGNQERCTSVSVKSSPRYDAAVGSGNDVLKRLLFGLLEEDGQERRAIDDDHETLRSSMISRGERGSSTGIVAMSSAALSNWALRAATASGELSRRFCVWGSDPGLARTLLESKTLKC